MLAYWFKCTCCCQSRGKRTLANLSQWEPARIDALRRALRGEFDHLPMGEPVCGPVFGVLYALKHVAYDLGISSALGHTRSGKLALFLILARVAHRGSRLSAVRWAQQHAVSEVLGLSDFDEDDLSTPPLTSSPSGRTASNSGSIDAMWPAEAARRSCFCMM
jgi:hypothetical protein